MSITVRQSLPTQKAKGARKKKESKKKKVKAVQKKQYAGVDKEFMEQAHLKQGPGDIIIGTPPTTRHSTEIHMRGEGSVFPLPPLYFNSNCNPARVYIHIGNNSHV